MSSKNARCRLAVTKKRTPSFTWTAKIVAVKRGYPWRKKHWYGSQQISCIAGLSLISREQSLYITKFDLFPPLLMSQSNVNVRFYLLTLCLKCCTHCLYIFRALANDMTLWKFILANVPFRDFTVKRPLSLLKWCENLIVSLPSGFYTV